MEIAARANANRSEWVKSILGNKGLTLHRVSEESARQYGRSSASYIQHNFYYALRSSSFTPNLLQVCALSSISGYRLYDWLAVFGFDLGRIPQLQVTLPSRRTILLDTALQNDNARIPWFRDVPGSRRAVGIVPFGRLLELSGSRRLGSPSVSNKPGSLYAKVGVEDALAFPDLRPGSIVRVNTGIPENLKKIGKVSEHIFLIEHSNGLWCSRLYFSGENQIHPMSNQLPYARVELRIPAEARILGFIDMEIRRMGSADEPEVPVELARQWKPGPLNWRSGGFGLGGLLRGARGRAALSLREASAMSRKVADAFADERYFAAPGSLSDYEAQTAPPRHIHKAITLCLIYAVSFSDLLTAVGIKLGELGRDSIPSWTPLIVGHPKRENALDPVEADGGNSVLASLMSEFGDVPFFLRGSLAALSGVNKPSLRDLFYLEPESDARHSYLREALLLMVNRHKRNLTKQRSVSVWHQPLYLLLTREGRYMCAYCSLENGILVATALSAEFRRAQRFRNHDDVEVIGQVVIVVRRVG